MVRVLAIRTLHGLGVLLLLAGAALSSNLWLTTVALIVGLLYGVSLFWGLGAEGVEVKRGWSYFSFLLAAGLMLLGASKVQDRKAPDHFCSHPENL